MPVHGARLGIRDLPSGAYRALVSVPGNWLISGVAAFSWTDGAETIDEQLAERGL